MPRPSPVFEPLEIAPGLTVKIRTSVLVAFPDAPAFLRDLYVEKKQSVTVATMLSYARRIAHLVREGRVEHPKLCTYNLESTALHAYWAWIARHYEARVEKAYQVFVDNRQVWAKAAAPHITLGCLARPWPGKLVIRPQPWRFAEEGRPVFTTEPCSSWTLHVPQLTKNGTSRLPPHKHEDPDNLCGECAVIELSEEELQALAAAFYDAWGNGRDPFSMPHDTPLFGRAPLKGAFARNSDPIPFGSVCALTTSHSPLEGFFMKFRGAQVTPNPAVFLERFKTAPSDIVVLDWRALMGSDPRLLRELFDLMWTQATKEGAGDNTIAPIDAVTSSDDDAAAAIPSSV